MSVNITSYINQITDQATRIAMQKLFEVLIADLNTNKAAFAAHTHRFGRYRVFGACGLAAQATADPDIKTVNNIYFVDAADKIQVLTAAKIDISAVTGYTPVALPTAQQKIYLVTVDATTGAVGITDGVAHASAAVMPATPTGKIAIGWFKIVNTSGGNYTPGTTNMDTVGITDTYGDLSQDDPDGSQTSVPDATAATYAATLAKVFSQNLVK